MPETLARTTASTSLLALLARPQWRTRWLPAAGVLAGLGAAGIALFHRAELPQSIVPPGYVALVNEKGVLMSDFIAQTATEMEKPFAQTTAAQRRRVLHEMINEELMVQRALALDLPETTTQVRDVMVQATEAQVAAPFQSTPPTDAQLKSYYDAHHALYVTGGTMLVRDLVLHVGGYQNADQSFAQAETDANEAVYQLRAGNSIDYVMEHYGFVDSGRIASIEELEMTARLLLGERLYPVAASLSAGEISAPVADSDGVHLLVMQSRDPPRLAEFGTVRAQVYSDYAREVNQRATRENLQMLRAQSRILLAPGQSE